MLPSRLHPKECFTKVVVSCWLVWACKVSPADLLALTKAPLWLFFVWESDFHCLGLFIYFFQMSVSLSVLVRSQKGSVLAFHTKNLGLHSLVKDSRQLSKDLIHFKWVKLKLCESSSPHSLLSSFIQADSVMCSEQASVKGYIDIITILPLRTSPEARAYVFFPYSKFLLKPSRVFCEQNQVPKILKKVVSLLHACVCV